MTFANILLNASVTITKNNEETLISGGSIYQDKKSNCGDTKCFQFPPFLPKTTPLMDK